MVSYVGSDPNLELKEMAPYSVDVQTFTAKVQMIHLIHTLELVVQMVIK